MPLNYAKLMATKFARERHTYTRRDTILYALGVGVGAHDPVDEGELKYVYERELVALPTQAVTLAANAMLLADPAFGVNYRMVLHAEQSLRMHQPLPVEGSVYSELQIDEIYDKGAEKGAVMYLSRRLYDASNDALLATVGSAAFLRGDGGFGGRSEGQPKPRAAPKDRPADCEIHVQGTHNQALIYRLSGDYNPLHADPEAARGAGFPRPILHGLCAYGMVGRALVRALCNDDPAKLRRLDVRFTSPVFPGERLRVQVWNIAAGDAAFRVFASDRNALVLDYGRVESDWADESGV